MIEVTSNDIKLEAGEDESHGVMPVRFMDKNGNMEDPILLMKLSKNQLVDFHLIAKKDIAKSHAKWSPVATCIMKKEPKVELNQDIVSQMTLEQKKQFVECCPRKVFNFSQMRQAIDIEDSDKCNLCEECTKVSERIMKLPGAVSIGEVQNKFVFTIESTGAISPVKIMLIALKVLKHKLTTLKNFF